MNPKPGDVYQHYKGNYYKILNIGRHTETTEKMVIYQLHDGGTIWIRPLDMFLSMVVVNDKEIPRFKKIEQEFFFHNS